MIERRPEDIYCLVYEGLSHWAAMQHTYGGSYVITPRCTFKTHGASVRPPFMEFPTCFLCAQWHWV